MDPSRKPPTPARASDPRAAKTPGRALDEHGRVSADERAVDAVKVRRAG